MGDAAEDAERRAEREREDEDIIDAEVEETENLPAVRGSGMLLAGTDTTAKLAHAMEIATALSNVIDQQKLFVSIGGKKHVLVEGWELLGSLLGVFPVVEWTRKLDNGWEARVVAKTLDGAEVGSAEMMCTRDEGRWRSADDYAIRSMAQTRAVSKSLRAPLGFVMKLAGYEPTPEAEIPPESATPKPFDPATDLLPGALHGEGAPKAISAQLDLFDPTVDWADFLGQITKQVWKKDSWRDLAPGEQKNFWRRLSNAVEKIKPHLGAGDMPPLEADKIMSGFIFAFNDQPLAIVLHYKQVEKPEPEEPEEKAPISAEQAAEIDKKLAEEDVDWPDDDKGR